MKRGILFLLVLGSIFLTACGTNGVLLSEGKSTIEGEVGDTKKPASRTNEEPTKEPTTETNESEKKEVGIKLNAVSAVDLSQYTNNEELSLSESPTAKFILTTDSTLSDFRIQSIENDGIQCEVKEDLYTKEEFDTNMSLKVMAYIPETFSNLLISFKKDGKTYQYFVNSNMTGEGPDAGLQQTTIEGR